MSTLRPAEPPRRRRHVLMALDWYDHELHRGIATYARERHWILNTQMSRLRLAPQGWIGDGAIGLFDEKSPLTEHLLTHNIPAVDIGSRLPKHFAHIKTDNAKVGKLAAAHFLERGHKQCVFVFLQNSSLEAERCEGFRAELQRAGVRCLEWRFRQGQEKRDLPYAPIVQWFSEKLSQTEPPVAVFAQNDDAASILLAAAVESGFRVPEQAAILGADNTGLICEFAAVPLSSVDCNLFQLGYRAAGLLDRIMKGSPIPNTTASVGPNAVVLRESTDFLAVANPHVMKVLDYIRRNFARGISVGELARQVPVSRSVLYRLFTEEVGRSMVEELGRVRISHAKKLLRETKLKIGEITTRSGFSGNISFSRAFQHAVGMSPSEYRAKYQAPPPESTL